MLMYISWYVNMASFQVVFLMLIYLIGYIDFKVILIFQL